MYSSYRILALTLAVAMAAGCAKEEGAESTPSDLSSDAEKFGYAIGVDLGRSLAVVKDEVDVAALKKGMDEMLDGKEPRLSDAQREEIKATVSRRIQQQQLEDRTAKAEAARQKGEEFLANNAKREGVKTTESGLQYEIIEPGKGTPPKAEDKVTVHYRGTFVNGEEFDSSHSRGQPATFPLANVIPGWTEGVQLMKPGAKYKFYIPSELAYGERGAGQKIGPHEALIFEIELLGVNDEMAQKDAAKPAEQKKPTGEKPAEEKPAEQKPAEQGNPTQ